MGKTGKRIRKVQPGKCSQNRGLRERSSGLGVCGVSGFPGEMPSELGLKSQAAAGPLVKGLKDERSLQPEGTACLSLGSRLLSSEGMLFAFFWYLTSSVTVLSAVLNVQCSTVYMASAPRM